jgi:hypothetical protein
MSSRAVRDVALAGLLVVALLVFRYVLHETWLNTILILVIAAAPGLVLRISRRRAGRDR